MNRYFIVHDLHLPTLDDDGQPMAGAFGKYHYIPLDSHGPNGADWNLLCLIDAAAEPCASWLPLPLLYDQRTPIAEALPYNVLADLGITDIDYMPDLLDALRPINAIMAN